MDNLDLNLIRVLGALLEHRNVSRAAAALQMSQPGLSYSLKRLRAYFGDPLFVRTRAGLEPTEAALRVAPVTETILRQARDQLVPAMAFSASSSTRTFTVMMSDLGEMIVLPKLLRALARRAPGVNVRVYAGTSHLAAALQSGEIDLMVGTYPDQVGTEVFQQRLYTHGFTCLARKGHPLAVEGIDRETFLSLQHASIRTTGQSQQLMERYFAKHGLPRRVIVQTPHILSVPFLVAATDIVVTLPAAVGELFSTLALIQAFAPPMALPKLTIRQYWHRRQHRDPASLWLRSLVNELFHGPEGWRLES